MKELGARAHWSAGRGENGASEADRGGGRRVTARARRRRRAGAARTGLGALAVIVAASAAAPRATAAAGAERRGDCAADMVFGIVHLEGDPAPGTGAAFQSFDRPNIGVSGAVFFGADTDGPASADEVLYVDATLIAREGDAAPGLVDATFNAFPVFDGGQQINAGNEAAYVAQVALPGGETALAVYRDGTLIAFEGGAVPGIPGRLFSDFSFVGLADDGAVGFLTDIDGSTSDDSVVYFGGTPVYRQGSEVPFLPGETWDGNFGQVAWNARGDVLVVGNTSLPTSMDIVVVRRLRGDTPVEEIVAQEGQPVEAAGGTDFLDVVLGLALADNGAWALRGNLELAPADADGVILSGVGFFAQSGDDVPEIPGAKLGDFTGLDINGLGDVLYLADIVGAPDVDEGIFLNGCMLVTDGSQVPGLPEGTLFSDLGFGDLYLNDAGDAVFAASYTGAMSGDGLFRLVLPGECREDVNGTGDVGFDDVLAVLREWGACPPQQMCPADVDGNGVVEYPDVVAVLSAWGPCN